VEAGTGRLVNAEHLPEREAPETGAAAVETGAVLFGKLRPYLAKSWLVDQPIYASTELLALKPRDGADPRWLAYVCRSKPLVEWSVATSDGAKMPRTTWEKMGDFRVDVPPLSAQRATADFLDAETARIDVLIARKHRMIDLLNEHFTNHVSATLEAITRRVPLRHFARWREGPGILAVDFREAGTPLIRLVNLVEDTIKLDGCGYLDPDDVAARWWHLRVREGELLVSGSAASGLPVVVPQDADGAVPYTGLIRMWPTSEALSGEFLRLFLGSNLFRDQVDQLKTGVAIQHWGPSHLGQVSIPLPERRQQDEIAKKLLAERVLARETGSKIQRQIELLREHRQALITAAVTGELDVAKAAA